MNELQSLDQCECNTENSELLTGKIFTNVLGIHVQLDLISEQHNVVMGKRVERPRAQCSTVHIYFSHQNGLVFFRKNVVKHSTIHFHRAI